MGQGARVVFLLDQALGQCQVIGQSRCLVGSIPQLMQGRLGLKQIPPAVDFVRLENEKIGNRTGHGNKEDNVIPVVIHTSTMGVHQHPNDQGQMEHRQNREFRH